MTQEQLKTFIYSCLSFANVAHYDEDRFIENFINKGLDNSTFTEVIMRNYNIAENLHFGVCFTMTCWAYHLLCTMGINSDYYIFETTEKKTGYPNYVLLYNVEGEYCICDLAAQIQKIEELHRKLFLISQNPDYYGKESLDGIIKELINPEFINQSIEKYKNDYIIGSLVDAKGIEDDRIFSEIPEISLAEFLKNKNLNPLAKY